MAVVIDESWLEEQGVEVADAEADELIDAAMDEFELRVGMEIASKLTKKQITEFENINDEDARVEWLDKALPSYPGIVDQKFTELSEELRKSTDKIVLLRSWAAE